MESNVVADLYKKIEVLQEQIQGLLVETQKNRRESGTKTVLKSHFFTILAIIISSIALTFTILSFTYGLFQSLQADVREIRSEMQNIRVEMRDTRACGNEGREQGLGRSNDRPRNDLGCCRCRRAFVILMSAAATAC